MAASSVGKWPRVLMILRNCIFKLSMELIVQITRLIHKIADRPWSQAPFSISPHRPRRPYS